VADKAFLDANALFSAAYTPGSRLRELWSLEGVRLVTSLFALEEARRNLAIHRPDGLAELDHLIDDLVIVPGVRAVSLPDGIELADKDVPILPAAIQSSCNHLLTGDMRHFGSLLGQAIEGVLVQTPAQFLRSRRA
jgi:uncharacterized protein